MQAGKRGTGGEEAGGSSAPLRASEPFLALSYMQGLVVSLVWFALGALLTYSAQQLAAPAGGGGAATTAATAAATTAAHIQQQQQPAKIAADRHHQVPCPPPRQPGTKRRNLVFAAVGEGWTADK